MMCGGSGAVKASCGARVIIILNKYYFMSFVLDSDASVNIDGVSKYLMTVTDAPCPVWVSDVSEDCDVTVCTGDIEKYGFYVDGPSDCTHIDYNRVRASYINHHTRNIGSNSCAWQAAYMAAAFTSGNDSRVRDGLVCCMPHDVCVLYNDVVSRCSITKCGISDVRNMREATPEDFLLLAVRDTIYAPIPITQYLKNPQKTLSECSVLFASNNLHYIALVKASDNTFMVCNDADLPSQCADSVCAEVKSSSSGWCICGILRLCGDVRSNSKCISALYNTPSIDSVHCVCGKKLFVVQRKITEYADSDLERVLDRMAPSNSLYCEFVECAKEHSSIIVRAGTGEGKSRIALKLALDSFVRNVQLERSGKQSEYITLIAVPYVVIAEQFFNKLAMVRLPGDRPLFAKMLTSTNVCGNSVTLSWKKAAQERVTHAKYDTGSTKGALIAANRGKPPSEVVFNDRYDSMKNVCSDVIVGTYEMIHALVMKKSDDILGGKKKVCVVFDEVQEALTAMSKRFVNAFTLLHSLVGRRNDSNEKTVLLTGSDDVNDESIGRSMYTGFLNHFHILQHSGLPKLITERLVPSYDKESGCVSGLMSIKRMVSSEDVCRLMRMCVYVDGWKMCVNNEVCVMDSALRDNVRCVLCRLVDASTTFTAAASSIIRYWMCEVGELESDYATQMIMINNKSRAFDVDYILLVYVKLMLVCLNLKPLPVYSQSLMRLTYICDDEIRNRRNCKEEYVDEETREKVRYCDMKSDYKYNIKLSKEGKAVSGIVFNSVNVSERVARMMMRKKNELCKIKPPCEFYMPVRVFDTRKIEEEVFSKSMLVGCLCDGDPYYIESMEAVRALAASMFVWHANADYDDEDLCERDFLMSKRAPPVIVATQKISVGADLPNIQGVSVMMDKWDYDKLLIEQVIGRVDRERISRYVCAEYSSLRSDGILSQHNINHNTAMAMTNEFYSTALEILSDPTKHSEAIFIDVLLDTVTPISVPVQMSDAVVDVNVCTSSGEMLVKSDKLPWVKCAIQSSITDEMMKLRRVHLHDSKLLMSEVSPITRVKFAHSFYNVERFVDRQSLVYGTAYAFTQTIAHLASRLHMDNPNLRNILTLGIIAEWPDADYGSVCKLVDYIPDGVRCRFVMTGNDDDECEFVVMDRSDKKSVSIPQSLVDAGGVNDMKYSVSSALSVADFLSRVEEMGASVSKGSCSIIVCAYMMFSMGFRTYKSQPNTQLSEEIGSIVDFRRIAGVEKEWFTANSVDVYGLMRMLDKLAPADIDETVCKSRCVRSSKSPHLGDSRRVYKRPASKGSTTTIHSDADVDEKCRKSGDRYGLFSNSADEENVKNVYGAVRCLEVMKSMKLREVRYLDTRVHRENKSSKLFYDLLDVVNVVNEWCDEMCKEGANFHGKPEDAQLYVSPPFRFMCGLCRMIKRELLDRIPVGNNKEENDKLRKRIVCELVGMGIKKYSDDEREYDVSERNVSYMPFRVHPFFAGETPMVISHDNQPPAEIDTTSTKDDDDLNGLE